MSLEVGFAWAFWSVIILPQVGWVSWMWAYMYHIWENFSHSYLSILLSSSRFPRTQITQGGLLTVIQQAPEALLIFCLLATFTAFQCLSTPGWPEGRPCSSIFPRNGGCQGTRSWRLALSCTHEYPGCGAGTRVCLKPPKQRSAVMAKMRVSNSPRVVLSHEEACKSCTNNRLIETNGWIIFTKDYK